MSFYSFHTFKNLHLCWYTFTVQNDHIPCRDFVCTRTISSLFIPFSPLSPHFLRLLILPPFEKVLAPSFLLTVFIFLFISLMHWVFLFKSQLWVCHFFICNQCVYIGNLYYHLFHFCVFQYSRIHHHHHPFILLKFALCPQGFFLSLFLAILIL